MTQDENALRPHGISRYASLSLGIVTCFTVNGYSLQEPALPVLQHRLPFVVIILIDTDLCLSPLTSVSERTVDKPSATHLAHNMLVAFVNLELFVLACYTVKE